jgi:hypothetical protein
MNNNQTDDKAADTQVDNLVEAAFEARSQAVLRESANYLDGRTQSRLTQARYAALEASKLRASNLFGWKLLAPVSATVAAVLAVMLMPNQAQHPIQPAPLAGDMPDKIEILAAEDGLEFYRDVEFYAWLDTVLDDSSNDSSSLDENIVDKPQSEV